ncbi:TnsA endonuclease N-terminal domain-containing protein [Endozoicomonas acroporae]|uniref:TnsA endonuclease N-terminal domain-containing protein n=1 Tax=Endozoicomonas acroporae TaxID=1701104 RepID=UPI001C60EE9F|nr:TnsA endonuclease N-terminal domain-containing protein [Endozoicomonas acroporae]
MEYLPFILVGEFSSSGESIRVKSITVGRIHHFHSGIELAPFLVFDRHKDTVDIREQFPLPLQDTLNICRQLGIRHPQVKGELSIVSTDLLIDISGGKQIAIAVKKAESLDNKRILEKLQVEKAYWEASGASWFVFTERDISETLKVNLKWLKPFLNVDTQSAYDISDNDVISLIKRIQQYPNNQAMRLCGILDDEYQLEPGSHAEFLRFSVARGYLEAPIGKQFTKWKCAELTDRSETIFKEEAGYAS